MTADAARTPGAPGAPLTPAPPHVVHVYAVARSPLAAPAPGVPGLHPGGPLRTLAAAGLAAVVQDLPADTYGEDAWRRLITDLRAVERAAVAHHGVVTATAEAAGGPVVPLALGTLYRSDDRVRTMLADGAARFTAALDRVTGHAEWGVKVYADRARPAGPPVNGPVEARAATPRDGRAYLARRRAQYRERERAADDALGAVAAVERAVGAAAAAVRRLRAHEAGPGGPQLLNAACLVAHGREAELMAAVAEARRLPGVRVELTGPWIPYSFAGTGEGAA